MPALSDDGRGHHRPARVGAPANTTRLQRERYMSLSRFSHLEKARESDAEPPPKAAQTRFTAAPIADVAQSFVAPPPPESLQLQEADASQPFIRCNVCEADNSIHAARCMNCRSHLDTAEQRAFNEAYWKRRVAEQQAETKALDDLNRVRDEEAAAQRERQRALSEAMAREIAQGSRERFLRETGSPFAGTPPGLALLRMIPNARVRAGIFAAFLVIPPVLVFLGKPNSGVRASGALLATILIALFLPPGVWRRRRSWFD